MASIKPHFFDNLIVYMCSCEDERIVCGEISVHCMLCACCYEEMPGRLNFPGIDRYDSMLVAEADMDSRSQEASTSGSGSETNNSPAGKGDGAFNTLAKYIFGGNAAGARMSMTTPVFSDNRGAMQFVIEPGYQVSLPCLSRPHCCCSFSCIELWLSQSIHLVSVPEKILLHVILLLTVGSENNVKSSL